MAGNKQDKRNWAMQDLGIPCLAGFGGNAQRQELSKSRHSANVAKVVSAGRRRYPASN